MKKVLLLYIVFCTTVVFTNITPVSAKENLSFKATKLIYERLIAYGDIQKYGFRQSPNIKLKHSIIGFFELPYTSGKHMLAVTSSSPEKNNDCHVCAPKLSFFEFTVNDGEWLLYESYINAIQFGSFGEAPNTKDIEVIRLNENVFGLLFNASYGNHGCIEKSKNIYIFDNKTVKSIFSVQVSFSDSRTAEPDTEWQSTTHFDKSATPLYDIVLHKTGVEDGEKINKKLIYRFNGTKYIKKE